MAKVTRSTFSKGIKMYKDSQKTNKAVSPSTLMAQSLFVTARTNENDTQLEIPQVDKTESATLTKLETSTPQDRGNMPTVIIKSKSEPIIKAQSSKLGLQIQAIQAELNGFNKLILQKTSEFNSLHKDFVQQGYQSADIYENFCQFYKHKHLECGDNFHKFKLEVRDEYIIAENARKNFRKKYNNLTALKSEIDAIANKVDKLYDKTRNSLQASTPEEQMLLQQLLQNNFGAMFELIDDVQIKVDEKIVLINDTYKIGSQLFKSINDDYCKLCDNLVSHKKQSPALQKNN